MVLLTCFGLALAVSSMSSFAAPGRAAEVTHAQSAAASPGQAPTASVRVLVFHGPADQQDDPVAQAVTQIRGLGNEHGFAVDESTDPGAFTSDNLARYRAVVLLSANGATLSAGQQAAFQDYIGSGGGFAGIGNAASFEPSSSFFDGLIGARPDPASPSGITTKIVTTGDRVFPGVKDTPLEWKHSDKWFSWTTNPTGSVHTLERIHDQGVPTGDGATGGTDRPITWCRDFSGGRSFYTGMGRGSPSYSETNFRDVLLGGIEWTSGMVRGNCKATIASYYHMTRLTPPNDPGTLDHAGEPDGLAVAPDGRVVYIGRASCMGLSHLPQDPSPNGALNSNGVPGPTINGQSQAEIFTSGPNKTPTNPQGAEPYTNPDYARGCGTIHVYDPRTNSATEAGMLDVVGNLSNGSENDPSVLTGNPPSNRGSQKIELGLIGIALDPNFEQNHYIYVQWDPWESFHVMTDHTVQQTISRFILDPDTNQIDMSSRTDIIHWTVQGWACCHTGGGMAFDSHGNLYFGVGDNTGNYGNGGYSNSNPTLQTPGPAALYWRDARRTSGNTNDLNGKINRIHPLPVPNGEHPAPGIGSTYTIPDGPHGPNLFPPNSQAVQQGKARPEIYVMGVRNQYRLSIDPGTDILTAGFVGPDALKPDPALGPAKYEEAMVIDHAQNLGWPYCLGNKQPYRAWALDGTHPGTGAPNDPAGWYDCANIQNTSPANTGLTKIPPASSPNIWYSPQGGCPDYPRTNGTPSEPRPTYDVNQATYHCPWVRDVVGGQAIIDGPTFRYPKTADPSRAWPRYWDGKWFLTDFDYTGNLLHSLTMDPKTMGQGGQPTFVDSLKQILPLNSTPGWNGGDDTLIDWKFGPDGALYLLNYGHQYFGISSDSSVWRVDYTGGPDTPYAAPGASAAGNGQPLSEQFSAGKSGGVSYQWDFGDGSPRSTQQDPVHSYTHPGTYTAHLTVTYADGSADTGTMQVKV
jgi:type 1 glutamine amidotransferase/glucose/arabinose dehydrogenase